MSIDTDDKDNQRGNVPALMIPIDLDDDDNKSERSNKSVRSNLSHRSIRNKVSKQIDNMDAL